MTVLISPRWSDERETRIRRRRWPRQGGGAGWPAGKGRSTPSDVPPAEGVQVLLGQDRRHQLQGHQAPDAVRARAREDSSAPDFGDVRDAPAEAAHGDYARASARVNPVRRRVVGQCRGGSQTRSWRPGPFGSGKKIMEVILRDHVEKLGKRGEIVKVSDGYARNYLLPRKLALPATAGNRKHVERERKTMETREAEEKSQAEAIASRLAAIDITIARRVAETGQ